MILRDLINRIKDRCPIFERRVYGSAQLDEGLRQAENVPVPTAFVMVDGDFPAENSADAGVIQQTQERWTIVVVVSNKDDMRGQMAADGMHSVRRQLLGALLNWENAPDRDENDTTNTDNDWGPVVYRGSLHIDMSAARLWHQFSFGHTIILSAGSDYETLPELQPGDGAAQPAYRGGPAGTSAAEPFRDATGGIVPRSPAPPRERPRLMPERRPQSPVNYDADPYGLGDDDADA